MVERFTCEITSVDETTPRLQLAGEFDLAAVDIVERELAPVISSKPAAVVIDLRGVTFMDSTALEVLSQLNDTAQSDGFKLWITGGGGELDRVFRITGLDQVLPLVERVPDPGA